MIAVILGILKFIGVSLLVLLALVVLIILLLLLVPICYKFEGVATDNKKKAEGRLSFLGPAFSCRFGCENGNKIWYRVKVMGILMFSEQPKEKKAKQKRKKSAKILSHKEEKNKNAVAPKYDEKEPEIIRLSEQNTVKDRKEEFKQTEEIKKEKVPEKTKRYYHTSTKNKRNKKIQTWIHPFRTLRKFFTSFWIKIKKMWKCFWKIKDKISLILKLKNAETTKKAYEDVKKIVKFLLRHIRPRKIKGHVEFGMEDPAHTGEILAVAGVLYPVYRNHIRITPYFDKVLFSGEITLKGHIQIIYIAISALKIYTNKYLRKTIERWNRIIGGR